jgi:hypothetical protein
MDNAVRHMNEAWRKAIAREARELAERMRLHALGCPVCFSQLDIESCEALERALLKDAQALADATKKEKN